MCMFIIRIIKFANCVLCDLCPTCNKVGVGGKKKSIHYAQSRRRRQRSHQTECRDCRRSEVPAQQPRDGSQLDTSTRWQRRRRCKRVAVTCSCMHETRKLRTLYANIQRHARTTQTHSSGLIFHFPEQFMFGKRLLLLLRLLLIRRLLPLPLQ